MKCTVLLWYVQNVDYHPRRHLFRDTFKEIEQESPQTEAKYSHQIVELKHYRACMVT